MKLPRTLSVLSAILIVAMLAAACTFVVQPESEAPAAAPMEEASDWVAPEDALISMPAEEAPILDGMPDEAFWADAPAIVIPVEDGANMGSSEVTVKSVYSGDSVYFLVSWSDPTQSFVRSPWMKQDDGSWTKLVDPDDRGRDNND